MQINLFQENGLHALQFNCITGILNFIKKDNNINSDNFFSPRIELLGSINRDPRIRNLKTHLQFLLIN